MSFGQKRRKLHSLPARMRFVLCITGALLLFYISFRIGDYTGFIAFMVGSLTEAIIRRLKGEFVER
jgi:hypothetical protein